MSVAPAAEHDQKRRIGDILLELGFVTEKQLKKAIQEQEETGQPLGQILVEHGAITRLELASALAEQWSSHSPISPVPVQPAGPRVAQAPPAPHEEDQYAARLQAAVADLAQRGQETEENDAPDPMVTELAQRLEATVARAQRLEATVATLAESLDGMSGGVEEAFSVLKSGLSDMALDLARVETAVTDLAAHPAVDPGAGAAVADELRLALEALARRLDEVDTREAVAGELEAQRATLVELRGAVADLARRPAGTPGIDERLARIETQLEERARTTADAAAVEALAARIDETAAAHGVVLETLAQLRERVAELARPQDGPGEDAVRRVEALEARLAELTPALDARLAALDEVARGLVTPAGLADALTAVREDLRPAPVEPDPRVDRIAEGLADMAKQLERVRVAAEDDGGLRARLDALEDALARGSEQLQALAAADDVASLGAALEVLRAETAERVERGRGDAEARAAAIEARLDALDDLERLRAELDAVRASLSELAARPEAVTHGALVDALDTLREELARPDPRLEELAATLDDAQRRHEHDLASLREELDADLAGLRHALEAYRAAPTADPEQTRALAELTERLDRQAAGTDATLADLQTRLDAIPAAPVTPDDLGALREHLERELVTVRHELETLRAAPAADPNAQAAVAGLVAQIDELRRASEANAAANARAGEAAATSEALAGALDALRKELRTEIAQQPDTRVDALQAELVTLRHEVAQAIAARAAAEGDTAQLAEIAAHIDRQRDDIDSRMALLQARLEKGAPVSADDLARAIDGIRHEVQAQAVDLDPRIAQVAADVLALRAEMARSATAPAAPDPALAAAVSALQQRLDTLETTPAADAATAEAYLDDRMDEIVRAVTDRILVAGASAPAGAPAAAAVSGIPVPDGIAGDIERTRMAIERLSAHLGEHDRAIRDLVKAHGTGGGRRARGASGATIEGAPARGDAAADLRSVLRRIEGMEEDVREDREKLMKRFERLATSIDWRLQRLESDGEQ